MRELIIKNVPIVTFILFAAGQHKLKLSLFLLCRGLIQDSLVTEKSTKLSHRGLLYFMFIYLLGDTGGNHVHNSVPVFILCYSEFKLGSLRTRSRAEQHSDLLPIRHHVVCLAIGPYPIPELLLQRVGLVLPSSPIMTSGI